MNEPVRLAKRVAELRACSRREAERIITDGGVRVDGVVVEEPQFRVTDQRIDIDQGADPAQGDAVTLLLHKPVGLAVGVGVAASAAVAELLGPATLWAEDTSGIRPLKKHFAQLSLGAPLEASASGLVVYTQDWRVQRKLTEDAATLEHEVIVEVAGGLAPDGLKRMNRGVAYQGRTPAAVKVSWQSESRLRVALKGARPGEIAHLCEVVGLSVLSMKRIRLGGVALGKVPAGQWRYLRAGERF